MQTTCTAQLAGHPKSKSWPAQTRGMKNDILAAKPFENWTQFEIRTKVDHSKSRHVRFSDPLSSLIRTLLQIVLLSLTPFVKPEILRTSLEDVVLNIASLGLGKAEHFLDKCVDKPSKYTVVAAVKLLLDINALKPSIGTHFLKADFKRYLNTRVAWYSGARNRKPSGRLNSRPEKKWYSNGFTNHVTMTILLP